jgi:2-C-methyl-D-erythritol 4-phosphate cytidylyltransferase
MEISAIIAGAGKGVRFGNSEKVFLPLCGTPVIEHSTNCFLHIPEIKEVTLVVREEDIEMAREMHRDNNIKVISGGRSRGESIRKGVELSIYDFVLIHDAVRPLINVQFVQNIISSLTEGFDAVIPGIAIKYTVKERHNDFVTRTLDRRNLVEVQTPQFFRKSSLLRAYEKYFDKEITDESMLIERAGGKVRIVPGIEENIKITTPLDLFLVEEIFNKWKK